MRLFRDWFPKSHKEHKDKNTFKDDLLDDLLEDITMEGLDKSSKKRRKKEIEKQNKEQPNSVLDETMELKEDEFNLEEIALDFKEVFIQGKNWILIRH